jgi:hypothetical protein
MEILKLQNTVAVFIAQVGALRLRDNLPYDKLAINYQLSTIN